MALMNMLHERAPDGARRRPNSGPDARMASARWVTRICAGDLEDAVVGAGGQPLLLHGPLQQALGVGAQSQWTRIWRVVICALE
jgi:hypothetical protein